MVQPGSDYGPTEIQNDPTTANGALVCYGLMIATLFTAYATGLIALIIAYVLREDGTDWRDSHYTFVIRTFWISILYTVITAILAVSIGWIPLLGWGIVGIMALYTTVWFVGRMIVGLLRALSGKPINDPQSWMFE